MDEAELAEEMAKASAAGLQPGVATTSAGAGGFPGSGQALGAAPNAPATRLSAPQAAAPASTAPSGHSEEAIQTVS